jgi:hypothetical protein
LIRGFKLQQSDGYGGNCCLHRDRTPGSCREFRPYLTPYSCGTLIADLVDAHWFPRAPGCTRRLRKEKTANPLDSDVIANEVRVTEESGFD